MFEFLICTFLVVGIFNYIVNIAANVKHIKVKNKKVPNNNTYNSVYGISGKWDEEKIREDMNKLKENGAIL